MAYKPTYVTLTQPKAVGAYKSTAVAPAAFTPGTYTSKYADQLGSALDTVANWKYDPLQDASYQALAKVYGARGNIAAKNTLADAASLNGGYGTSYAVSAAQQARNQYNQELAALVPDLENAAYTRATGRLSALRDADDTDYGRFRDTEGDRQWQWSQAYNAYRDKEADNQWAYSQQYNAYRDALSDYQWGLGYNTDLYQYNVAQAEKAKSSGGGGGRRRSGGGGGYSSAYSGASGSTPQSLYDAAAARIKNAEAARQHKAAAAEAKSGIYSINTGKYVGNPTKRKIMTK